MKVRVDQASVGAGDLWRTELVSSDVVHLTFQLVHHLRRLYELIFIGVAQLRELVDVLCWADL